MNLEKEIIEYIKNISKKYPYIQKVLLFGSRARKDNELKSDIDLAVYSNESINEFIEDIELNCKTLLEFDFSHINKINDSIFIKQVENEGKIIYEKY